MEIGEKVTFYPNPEDHREHKRAVVVNLTPKMIRLQVEGDTNTKLCSPRKVLAGQAELIGD